MPEEQLALPEAQDVRPAVKQFFAYRAQVMTLELKELFRIGRRSLAIGFTVLFLSVLAGQTIARKIEPRALGKVIEESCSYSPGWRIGARSKSFSTIGGRSSAGATSIAGWGRPKWSSGLTGRARSGGKSCRRNEGDAAYGEGQADRRGKCQGGRGRLGPSSADQENLLRTASGPISANSRLSASRSRLVTSRPMFIWIKVNCLRSCS